VFYELGLAHAIGKPVIMVSESLQDIPFDLRALRVIDYDKNAPDWGEVLKAKIVKTVKVLDAPKESILSVFLKNDVSQVRLEVSPLEKELLALRQEMESLKRSLASSGARPRLQQPDSEILMLPKRQTVSPVGAFVVSLRDLSGQGAPVRLVLVPDRAPLGYDLAAGSILFEERLFLDRRGWEERLPAPSGIGEYEIRAYVDPDKPADISSLRVQG
jgi:hypothetical protein